MDPTSQAATPPPDSPPPVELDTVSVGAPSPELVLAGAAQWEEHEGQSGPSAPCLVSNVNWRVAVGDFWVVGGLPASGKSILLQTAAGLQRPLRGAVRHFGRDVGTMSASELRQSRRRIGMVFPDGGRLFDDLTVAENVALPLHYRQDEPESVVQRVRHLIGALGLEHHAGSMPGQLTRGLKQRAALARALALEPDVVFLDNPITGLDPGQSRWLLELIEKLANQASVSPGSSEVALPGAVVVAADDLRPWTRFGRQFALIGRRAWLPLGGREAVAASREPLLRELLADSAQCS